MFYFPFPWFSLQRSPSNLQTMGCVCNSDPWSLSFSSLSLFLCLLWLWLKKRQSWETKAHECIWSHYIRWVKCMPRHSRLNGCLCITSPARELFLPIAQIHYLLFYCIYLQVHMDPLGAQFEPQSSSNEAWLTLLWYISLLLLPGG